MEDSSILEAHDLSDNGREGFLRGFGPDCDTESQRAFHMLKCSMLKLALEGTDKVLKDHKTLNRNMSVLEYQAEFAGDHVEGRRSNLASTPIFEETAVEEGRDGAGALTLEENERVCRNAATSLLHHSSKDHGNVSRAVYSSSSDYDPLPLNILAFIMVLLIKTIGFQVSLVIKFFTFPLWLSYFFFMLLLSPFQILGHIRGYLITKLLRMWHATFINVTSAVRGGLKTQKSLAVNIGFALFKSIYVCFILVGMLVSGFVVSGYMMKHLVEKPIKTIETLNFDYTKPSPAAFVPLIMSSSVGFIPYGHKLQMTVSLTVPDSEYNHRLGVFQVRVEIFSATGNVTASSSHPCMLQFKSRPIYYIQTFLRSAPLIAGIQSETQVLNIKIDEHAEGLEPTACLKVILEQRAEFHHGGGIPQVYAGSLLLQSKLPQLKRLAWHWRTTIFVWTSIVIFGRAVVHPSLF